jgi:putative tryptophan/tyrosine transport system substrate-binding protein
MKRRKFVMLLSAAVATRPFRLGAQEVKKPIRIGFVPLGSSSNAYDQSLVEAFRAGLRQVNLIENQDVAVDIVWITSGPEKAVAELLQHGVDILVTAGSSASLAARHQTWTIPIVFISVGNPVGIGMAESNSRPGYNATGLSDILSELGGKLVGFAAELNKPKKVIDYLWYTGWVDGKERLRKTQGAAESNNLEFRAYGISNLSEAENAIAEIKRSGAISVIIQPSPFSYRERGPLIDLATNQGLGTIFAFPVAAREGALVGYGPDYTYMVGRAAFYVDRILKGTKPADLPIDEASKLQLVINLKTAKAIGVEVPPFLLTGADEVIE